MTFKTANYILRNIRLFARVCAQLTFLGANAMLISPQIHGTNSMRFTFGNKCISWRA